MAEGNIININGNASGIQIQQGSTNSSQVLNYGMDEKIDFEKCKELLSKIEKYENCFDDEFGEKSAEIKEAICMAKEAANSKNETRWKSAIGIIRELMLGAGGSIIAAGILSLL